MKKSIQLVLLLLTTSISVVGQQKLTLEEIWGGAFRTKGMDELNAMKNTNQYTVLNFDRTSKTMQIDLFVKQSFHINRYKKPQRIRIYRQLHVR